MKRKIGFVAAVILVGAFVVACNQKPTEPTATPAPSPTPAATEEPATSDLPSDSVIVEDTGLAQPVEQVTEEQAPTNEGATYESDPPQSEYQEARFNELVSKYITKWGCSQEEAEKIANDIMNSGQQAAAEEQQRIQDRQDAYEEFAKEDAQRAKEESDSYYMERYGITQDQAMGMSPDELIELFNQKHGG